MDVVKGPFEANLLAPSEKDKLARLRECLDLSQRTKAERGESTKRGHTSALEVKKVKGLVRATSEPRSVSDPFVLWTTHKWSSVRPEPPRRPFTGPDLPTAHRRTPPLPTRLKSCFLFVSRDLSLRDCRPPSLPHHRSPETARESLLGCV